MKVITRNALVYALVLLLVALGATVALNTAKADPTANCTESRTGDNHPNVLSGTGCDTNFFGYGRGDTIRDQDKHDTDVIKAGQGADTVYVNEGGGGGADTVYCGHRDGAKDVVYADSDDVVRQCANSRAAGHDVVVRN